MPEMGGAGCISPITLSMPMLQHRKGYYRIRHMQLTAVSRGCFPIRELCRGRLRSRGARHRGTANASRSATLCALSPDLSVPRRGIRTCSREYVVYIELVVWTTSQWLRAIAESNMTHTVWGEIFGLEKGRFTIIGGKT